MLGIIYHPYMLKNNIWNNVINYVMPICLGILTVWN